MYNQRFQHQNNNRTIYIRQQNPTVQRPFLPKMGPHSSPNHPPMMHPTHIPMEHLSNMNVPFQQIHGNFMPPQPFGTPSRPPLTASMLQQFQDADGHIDFNKMLSTVGQLANTVQQVTPVIKQLGSFMNQFR